MRTVTGGTATREAEALKAYDRWLRSWAAKRTSRARAGFARRVIGEWGLLGFQQEAVMEFFSDLRERDEPVSGWTLATYFSHFTCLSTFLRTGGYIEHDPMEGISRPRSPQSQPRPLEDDEIDRALSAARGDTLAFLRLALLQGLRAHEIAKIKGSDVTPKRLYVIGKGGKRATLPTHAEVWEMAVERDDRGHWFTLPNGEPVPPRYVTDRVTMLFRDLHIEGSVHRCRHSYGTNLLRQGVNIRVVQQLMRHSSLASTQIYTAVSEEEMGEGLSRLSARPGDPAA